MRSKDTFRHRAGFTIVELLIVIVVIAILAAITIVAYNGVTKQAVEASMKSGLRSTVTSVELTKVNEGNYPVDSALINDGQGLSYSGDTRLSYVPKPYGYCVGAKNPARTDWMRIKSTSGQIEDGDCATTAGVSWTTRTSPLANAWSGVAYGNGRFVAVSSAASNQVITSTDGGTTWATATFPATRQLSDITYGNGLFVAVSTNAPQAVVTSPDGVTWTLRTTPGSVTLQAVTYGNGRFVAVGSVASNEIMTSTDGVTWTSRAAPVAGVWSSVAYGNGRFVAVTGNGTNAVMSSADGLSWVASAVPEQNGWAGITYGGGRFVATATAGPSQRQIMTSTDGTNWTIPVSPSGVAMTLRGITYGDGKFVTVAQSGSVRAVSSLDGVEWTTQTTPGWARAVAFGGGCFVAVGSDTANRIMNSCE